jgi:hypothetical protein
MEWNKKRGKSVTAMIARCVQGHRIATWTVSGLVV